MGRGVIFADMMWARNRLLFGLGMRITIDDRAVRSKGSRVATVTYSVGNMWKTVQCIILYSYINSL